MKPPFVLPFILCSIRWQHNITPTTVLIVLAACFSDNFIVQYVCLRVQNINWGRVVVGCIVCTQYIYIYIWCQDNRILSRREWKKNEFHPNEVVNYWTVFLLCWSIDLWECLIDALQIGFFPMIFFVSLYFTRDCYKGIVYLLVNKM